MMAPEDIQPFDNLHKTIFQQEKKNPVRLLTINTGNSMNALKENFNMKKIAREAKGEDVAAQ